MRSITTLAACLLFTCAAQAQNRPVGPAIEEAEAVHSIATAARLCSLISESELTRATTRMDRVHRAQLSGTDQETYLILRTSDSFRNMVFASALRRAQAGCAGELAAVWHDVESTLVTADLASGSTLALGGSGSTAR
jgi:hypothetical protein